MVAESSFDERLRAAHNARVAAQFPNLGWVVTGGSILWFAIATLADPQAFPIATSLGSELVVLALQGGIFALAVRWYRRREAPTDAAMRAAVATCLGVGLIWVAVLTATATMAAMLTLGVLTLFSVAPLVLAWGLGPQLVFQGGLTLLWIGLLGILPRHLPLSEVGTALAAGNFVALVATQWSTNGFRAEVLARFAAIDFDRQLATSRDAYRALAENAVDFIWALDLQGRWTYVNEALARRCGLTAATMVGRDVREVLTPHPANAEPATLIARMVDGQPVEPQLFEMATPDGPCWVEAVATAMRGPTGELIGVQGVSRDITERRLAEGALRASEERFRGVFTNAPVGMAVIAPDGEVVEVNGALASMLGYETAELVGVRVWDVLHPDDVSSIQSLVEATLAGQRDGFMVECRHLHRDGHVVWNEVHAFFDRTTTGTARFISQVTDITDQRAAEAALRASERRFRSFADSMAAGVLIAERDGIAYANDAASAITGYSREELLRMQIWDLVHVDERPVARARVRSRLDGARLMPRVEYRLATKSGEPRWVDITVAMLDLDGTPVMLGAAFDVTERKLAEQALRASEARYRGLLESQRELVARFDPQGIVTFANDVYCKTYGLRREDVIGHPFWPVVHPDDVQLAKAGIAAALRPPHRGESEIRSATVSGWRWFEWEGSAIRDAQGAVVEIQATGRDATERRRAQDALRASLEELRLSQDKLRYLTRQQVAVREEERKRLSFDLHDDVCQELVGIRILTESVTSRLGEGASDDVTFDLGRVSSHLREVVDHLRVLARDLRPLLLHDLGLEGSLRSLATGLSSESTTVHAVFATPIPRLDEWREVSVYRIAQEAVTNAVRHAAASRITVTLGADDEHLCLEVRDDGRGFDAAERDGYAFGLTSMEERAEALAGRFTLRSAPGAGTIVELECPMDMQSPVSTSAA